MFLHMEHNFQKFSTLTKIPTEITWSFIIWLLQRHSFANKAFEKLLNKYIYLCMYVPICFYLPLV